MSSKPKISKRTNDVLTTIAWVAFVVDVATVASNYSELVTVCKTAILQARGPLANQTGVDNIRCENGFVLEGNCPLLDDYYDSVARNNANVTKLCKSQPVYKNRPACEAAKFYEPTCWQFSVDSCSDRSMLFWVCLVCTVLSGFPLDEKAVLSHDSSAWKLTPGRARGISAIMTLMKIGGKLGFRVANGFTTSPAIFQLGWILFGCSGGFVLIALKSVRKLAGTPMQRQEFRFGLRFASLATLCLTGVCVGAMTASEINKSIGVKIDLQMSMDFSLLPSLSINTLAVFATFLLETFRTGFNAVGGVVDGVSDIELM